MSGFIIAPARKRLEDYHAVTMSIPDIHQPPPGRAIDWSNESGLGGGGQGGTGYRFIKDMRRQKFRLQQPLAGRRCRLCDGDRRFRRRDYRGPVCLHPDDVGVHVDQSNLQQVLPMTRSRKARALAAS